MDQTLDGTESAQLALEIEPFKKVNSIKQQHLKAHEALFHK